jgi:DNA-binding MarR family transcriptional regulator
MPPPSATRTTADRLHSAAIRLLRGLRPADQAMGLTGPRASVLSVLVFAGPATLSTLAALEQVRPPTMTRLVAGLERDGLVRRVADPKDRRVRWIHPTPKGRRRLRAGRARRVARLSNALRKLAPGERAALARALPALERLAKGLSAES